MYIYAYYTNCSYYTGLSLYLIHVRTVNCEMFMSARVPGIDPFLAYLEVLSIYLS